MDIIRMVYH